ncbi:MAG: metal-sensing transcriptional repressor [Oscillospiraceae bacterium]
MKAEKQAVMPLLKTVNGQIGGIIKMVEDDRYCMDISKQVTSAIAILKKVNIEIIDAHMRGCVKEAFENGASEEKIEELISELNRMIK